MLFYAIGNIYFVSASRLSPLGYIFCRTVTAEIDNWLLTFDFCIVEGTLPSPRAPWLPKGPPPSLCRYIQVEGANIRMDIEGATIHMDIEGAKILMDTELSDPRSLMVWYSFDAFKLCKWATMMGTNCLSLIILHNTAISCTFFGGMCPFDTAYSLFKKLYSDHLHFQMLS